MKNIFSHDNIREELIYTRQQARCLRVMCDTFVSVVWDTFVSVVCDTFVGVHDEIVCMTCESFN